MLSWLRRLKKRQDGSNPDKEPPSRTSFIVDHIKSRLHGFQETTVKEVMVPRVDVAGMEIGLSMAALPQLIQESGHSRFPVFEENLDHIIGILYVKDLFQMIDSWPDIDLKAVVRKPLFVPESKLIDDLLLTLKSTRTHMAIVIDEYGGVSGLVTMEDILEELVGDIQDEYDEEEAEWSVVDKDTYRVSARANMEELGEALGFPLEDEDQDTDTIGGYVQHVLGRVPEIGDAIRYDGYVFTVEEMDGNRLMWLRAQRQKAGSRPTNEDETTDAEVLRAG